MKNYTVIFILLVSLGCKAPSQKPAINLNPWRPGGIEYVFDQGFASEHIYLRPDSTFSLIHIACWSAWPLWGKWYQQGDTVFLHSRYQPEDNIQKVIVEDSGTNNSIIDLTFYLGPELKMIPSAKNVLYLLEDSIWDAERYAGPPFGLKTSIIKKPPFPIDSVLFYDSGSKSVPFVPENGLLPNKMTIYFQRDPQNFRYFKHEPLRMNGDTLFLKSHDMVVPKTFIKKNQP